MICLRFHWPRHFLNADRKFSSLHYHKPWTKQKNDAAGNYEIIVTKLLKNASENSAIFEFLRWLSVLSVCVFLYYFCGSCSCGIKWLECKNVKIIALKTQILRCFFGCTSKESPKCMFLYCSPHNKCCKNVWPIFSFTAVSFVFFLYEMKSGWKCEKIQIMSQLFHIFD